MNDILMFASAGLLPGPGPGAAAGAAGVWAADGTVTAGVSSAFSDVLAAVLPSATEPGVFAQPTAPFVAAPAALAIEPESSDWPAGKYDVPAAVKPAPREIVADGQPAALSGLPALTVEPPDVARGNESEVPRVAGIATSDGDGTQPDAPVKFRPMAPIDGDGDRGAARARLRAAMLHASLPIGEPKEPPPVSGAVVPFVVLPPAINASLPGAEAGTVMAVNMPAPRLSPALPLLARGPEPGSDDVMLPVQVLPRVVGDVVHDTRAETPRAVAVETAGEALRPGMRAEAAPLMPAETPVRTASVVVPMPPERAIRERSERTAPAMAMSASDGRSERDVMRDRGFSAPLALPAVVAPAAAGAAGVGGSGAAVSAAVAAAAPVVVASERLGDVAIGIEGDAQELRVRLSGTAGAAGLMAAEAPRLQAELAANGVRVQSLEFGGRVEPAAGTQAGQNASGQSASGQSASGAGTSGFGQPAHQDERRQAAMAAAFLVEPEPGRGARRNTPSDRYA